MKRSFFLLLLLVSIVDIVYAQSFTGKLVGALNEGKNMAKMAVYVYTAYTIVVVLSHYATDKEVSTFHWIRLVVVGVAASWVSAGSVGGGGSVGGLGSMAINMAKYASLGYCGIAILTVMIKYVKEQNIPVFEWTRLVIVALISALLTKVANTNTSTSKVLQEQVDFKDKVEEAPLYNPNSPNE